MDDTFADAQKPAGKHHGFYELYRYKSSILILKAVRTYERRIAEHEAAIDNPLARVADFDKLDPRRQQALVMKVWPDEIVNYREQIVILESILAQRRK